MISLQITWDCRTAYQYPSALRVTKRDFVFGKSYRLRLHIIATQHFPGLLRIKKGSSQNPHHPIPLREKVFPKKRSKFSLHRGEALSVTPISYPPHQFQPVGSAPPKVPAVFADSFRTSGGEAWRLIGDI